VRPRELAVFALAAFLAPALARSGQSVADRLASVKWPALCLRHGWVESPCQKCAVWENSPYPGDQARADRAESRTIAKLERAENGG